VAIPEGKDIYCVRYQFEEAETIEKKALIIVVFKFNIHQSLLLFISLLHKGSHTNRECTSDRCGSSDSSSGKAYSLDSDIQRYCRFCSKWLHIKCLQQDSHLLSPKTKKQIWQSIKNVIICPTKGAIKTALCPISRGKTGDWGISGNINVVMTSYSTLVKENKTINFNGKILTNPPSWFQGKTVAVYQCPACGEGWL